MPREDRRKKGSVKQRKRKGFYGKRPQEKTDEFSNGVATTDLDIGSSSAVSDIPQTDTTTDRENISFKKLLNTSFEKFESRKRTMTREQAKNVGLGSTSDIEIANGFKIQDAVLLSDCISTAAVCSSCRKATSTLKLYQKNNEREGLSESLFLKCSSCEVVTPLSTSNRLGGKGGGSHEVNRRAVLSSHQFGHAGLTQFCAGMNFPPPVAKEAYNKHLIQIEKAAKTNAEDVMKDAAKRLLEKVTFECPDDIEKDGKDEIARVYGDN